MTAPALLYRPNARWQVWLAFGCAAALHLAAIAFARTEPSSPPFLLPPDNGVEGVIDPTPDQMLLRPVEPTPIEPPELVKPDQTFPEEDSAPSRPRTQNRKLVPLLVRSAAAGRISAPSFGSVKVLAIYAPRPQYPYEARRQHTTGSGLVILIIDPSMGAVTNAYTAESTGSVVLDNSAVNGLRRWRFKPGTVTKVQVPITYTLTGASY